MPPSEPVTLESIAAMLADLREQAAKPAGLLLTQAESWRFVGLSRAAWFRLKSADELPKPVHVEGVGVRYRKSDLEHFVAKLRPTRRKVKAEIVAEGVADG